MPSISNLTAINSSIAMTSGNYTDASIFFGLLIGAIALMVISRLVSGDSGRVLLSVMAFLIGVTATWASLGAAYISNTVGAVVLNNTTGVSTYYTYPVYQSIASPWLTIVCVIAVIFTFLNALDIFIVMMQSAKKESVKFEGINGVKFRG